MALKIYETPAPSTTAFSEDSEFTNPIRNAFDGRTGQVVQRRYFVRNDSSLSVYSGVKVTPIDTEGRNIVDGTDGFSFKMKVGDQQPLDQEWETIAAGNLIDIPNISDNTTFEPFWLRIEVPQGADVQSLSDVKLRVEGFEDLI